MNTKINLCTTCQKAMNPLFISFRVLTYQGLAIYEYNEFMRQLIYQFKGCFDYELCKVFLGNFAQEIRLMYSGYTIIPIPSFQGDDETRGFNHVLEISKAIGLEMMPIIQKTGRHKQATSNLRSREEIYQFLRLKLSPDLRRKKVLIIDDIYTTGSTIKAAINLIEKLNPKKISVLVVAKAMVKKVNK
ncbi:MAG: ComF family protein [Erysipelotrichia bacterium]|nr:ComF family protein [Erysipelotrichia bacterium]